MKLLVSNKKFTKIIIVLVLILAMLPIGAASASPLQAATVVAFDMVGSASQNLISHTNPYAGAFSSGGDGFEKYQRGVSASIPFAVLDDSLSIFTGDTLGIIKEGNTDEFFGVTDTENGENSGPVSASWTFDVSGFTDLELSVDVGAMGDFEASDTFTIEASFDGGPAAIAFASSVDEAGSHTYTLEGGASFILNDPMLLNGTILTNDLQTFTTPLAGSGSVLTLTLTAQTDGGSEAFVFQNLIISETEPAGPVINEFVFNHTGTDTEAFIEVFGDPSTDYSNLTVLEIEGDSSGAGVIDAVLPLTTTDADGFWLDDEDAENGTVSLLLVEGFTGAQGDDIDTDNDGVMDSTPWTRIVDAIGITDGGSSDHNYSGLVLEPGYDGVTFEVGGASRIPNGIDTDSTSDWVRNDYDGFGFPGFSGTQEIGEAINTPGAVNEVITVIVDEFGLCGDPATMIHFIQGAGMASPDAGNVRAVEAVVTATFNGPDQIGGYFLQEEDTDADGDPMTSEGLRVFDPNNTPNVGDVVRVRGSVVEYFDLTELTNVTDFAVCGTGVATAAELNLPVATLDDFEMYEGMLISVPQTLYISEYFNFDRYGEIVLSTDRQFQPTAVYDPGSPEADALLDLNLRSRIKMDDGRGGQNPDPAIHPNGSIFDLTNLFRGGDMLNNVTGVLDYNFGEYKIQPTQGADYTSANPRTAAPDAVGGNLKVASFNVLNYFTTLDDGDWICGPSQDMECRGADNADEFTRQRDKIIAALIELDADVVGLMEIENNLYDEAVIDLVEGLNDAAGPGTYAYVDTGPIGTDAIKVAFIYKPASVSLVGDYAVLDSSVDPDFIDTKNRPALAQTFMDTSTGGVFTAVVNHLKSKGSACDDVGDPDLDDGAGNCNLTRLWAAQALVDWLASDPTGSGDADFLIIGDLNSYDKEDPIDALLAGGFTDLLYEYIGEYAYTYVFDGQLGYLDHALANGDLLSEVTGAAVWHINADEPDLIDYDTSFKQDAQDAIYAPDPYRSSDHDPVLVGLNVCDEIAPTLEITLTPDLLWPANHKYVDVTATVVASDNFDTDPEVTFISVTSNELDEGLGDGDFPEDIVIVDDYTFRLRAERGATNQEGRTYTVTYQVVDDCGNVTVGSATVFVPFSMKKD